MADANKKLIIEISADNKDAIKKFEELSKQVGGVKVAFNDASKATDSSTASVFKGVAAWDLLKQGVGKTTDFMKDSIKAAIEAESKMNLVKATVAATGKSYEEVGPEIESFAAKMAQLGRDDEDVAVATANLAKLLNGDFKQAIQLTKLASDLTSSGFGDFESNVDNLTKILAGKGQRALMEYRISLDDNATTAEQLAAVTKKVTRTTEEWANTTEGKMSAVNVQWNNLKENIGNIFGPSLAILLNNYNEFLSTSADNTNSWGKKIGKTLESVVNGDMWIKLEKGAKSYYLQALKNITGNEKTSESIKKLEKDIEILNLALDSSAFNANKTSSDFKKLEISTDGIANKNEQAAKSYDDLTQKVKDFGKEAEDTNHKIAITVREYKEKQEKMLSDLLDKVKDINRQIDDENNNFAEGQAQNLEDLKKNIGEAVVAHEDKKNQLEKDLADEVAKGEEANQEKIQNLRDEIGKEEQFLNKHRNTIKNYEIAIDTIRENAHKDEIEKLIVGYEEKKAIDEKAHQERLTKLQETLAKENQAYKDSLDEQIRDTNQALEEIKRSYAQKFAEIQSIVKGTNLQKQVAQINSTSQTSARVGLPFYKFKDRPEIYDSATGAHIPNWDAFIAAGGKADFSNVEMRAAGGPVSGNTPYIVGEQGPELFVPKSSGDIIPRGEFGGGIYAPTININWTGAVDRRAAEMVANEIMRKLKTNVRIPIK